MDHLNIRTNSIRTLEQTTLEHKTSEKEILQHISFEQRAVKYRT